MLSFSTLGMLSDGILLQAGEVELKAEELAAELAKQPASSKAEMERNQLYLLEKTVTPRLLSASAQSQGGTSQALPFPNQDAAAAYPESITADLKVTDKEVAAFYKENKEMCGGAPLRKMKPQLRDYLLEQKKQAAIKEYTRTLGQRTPIVIASNWAKEQAALALDNPVDKARTSGLPSLVDFGSTGCRSCAMMAPILEALKAQYAGKANVLFIHVQEQPVLAERYGITTIPVQVFFDKDGREIHRNNGVMSREQIEMKLAEMGVAN